MFLKHIEYKVSSFALFKKGTLALPDENVPVAVDADTRAGIDSKKSRLRGHGWRKELTARGRQKRENWDSG